MKRLSYLALALLCAGCAPRVAAPPVETPNPKLILALDTTPRLVTSLDPTALTVQITDAAGKPVSGAAVTLSLDMPDMPMGRNEIKARETVAGTYAATGRFTMAGAWRVTVAATQGKDRTSRAFPVKVK